MVRVATLALVALCLAALSPRVSAQDLEFPKESDGYTMTPKPPKSSSENAPAGYTGRTEKMTETLVGNRPETNGRSFTGDFVMANKFRDCPNADGTEEGDGEFTVSGTFTHGSAASKFSMSAKAKYTGKVGDDAFFDGPVTADIDYTYTISPASGPRIDPISPQPIHESQQISIKFEVARGKFDAPTIGAFSGGDPSKGHLKEANAMGLFLTYWGGVYATLAEVNWLSPGKCVQVAFDPPSFSRQPVPGSNVKVNAFIKTLGGQGVRGKFPEVTAFSHDESVSITSSATDPGSPAIFYYTAPNKKLPHMGFGVSATSRAGVAKGNWETGLGTDWSGQITVSKVSPGEDRHSDLQNGTHYEATTITVNVQNGVGTANGFSEIHGYLESKHYVADGNGQSHKEFDYGNTDEATVQGQVKATVGVLVNEALGHYSVSMNLGQFPVGTRHTTSCQRDKCSFERSTLQRAADPRANGRKAHRSESREWIDEPRIGAAISWGATGERELHHHVGSGAGGDDEVRRVHALHRRVR